MSSGKKITKGQITGDKGIALIHRIALDMGFTWTSTSAGLDAGIDGYIELRDERTSEMLNLILQVQSKAGGSWFRAETETSFEFACDERDLRYWTRGNSPVILVVSRPDHNEAYWMSIKDYFATAERRQSRKILFDKKTDRFDVDARDRLASLAISADSGIFLPALPKAERLVSNLLPLVDFPRRLFRAATNFKLSNHIAHKLEQHTDGQAMEFVYQDGAIYSFHDLTTRGWPKVCIASTVDNLPAIEWSCSDDRHQRHIFVRLLKHSLEKLLSLQGITYCDKNEHFYFRPTADLSERKVGGLSVFKGYESKTTPGRIAYYRHRAMRTQFLRLDAKWYLEVTPSYHFTYNGMGRSRLFAERLSGIKMMERQNKTHLRQVTLWSQVLQQTHLLPPPEQNDRQKSLFGPANVADERGVSEPYSLIAFRSPVEFESEESVPEAAWLPSETNSDESSANGIPYRSLFG